MRVRPIVSTCRKSQARMPLAGTVRNLVHVGPVRRGAEPTRALVRIAQTVLGASRYPRPANSPWMRRHPHIGFSRAGLSTNSRTCALTGGRPGVSLGWGPPPRHQVAMPPQQRGRGDEEGRPPRPRQQPRQPGQHHPIRLLQIQATHLPAQHRDLMPKHQHLHRVGAIAPTPSGSSTAAPAAGSRNQTTGS
jgi:hypothetical protein